ncbi:hypothetical protein [Motilimonas sp. KMU-193]|uniref:hypothetical protein n=1 Tax=Motilimonas sp. KMU-193 TaxID=3388668 RepID=UPI00396B1256
MKKLALVFGLLLTVFSPWSLAEGKGEWIEIGHKTVSFKSETDEVKPYMAERAVSKIKLHVDQGTVRIKSVKVFMSNGDEKEYDVLGLLNKGMETRALVLPKGEDIKLERIELGYDSLGNVLISKRAKVTILGFKPAQ